jgi:GWxTD domain-containing protein
MCKRSYCWWIFSLTLILSLPTLAQDAARNLGQENVNYRHNLEAPLAGDTRVAMGDGEATVFFSLSLRSRNTQIREITYAVKESYEAETIITQGSIGDADVIREGDQNRIFRFTVPVAENSNYLFIFVNTVGRNAETPYRFDTALKSELNFPLTDLVLMEADEEVPIFSDFIPLDAPIRIMSLYQETTQAFIYYYDHNFEPNPPPMASSSSQVKKSLQIDSIFPVRLNETVSFENEGLYFTQTDTTSLSGISFRVEKSYYPRFVTSEKLIQPIRYISTSDEMDNLLNNEEAKLALDRYWIKATRSRERAKDVIRSYYRQVTRANVLFTSYKEGWKTSQGMVYLLYGPPDIVYRSNGEEQWVYNQGTNLLPEMSFTFVKVRNIFSNQHYNLLPDESYSRFWYRNIDLWRKGRKQI